MSCDPYVFITPEWSCFYYPPKSLTWQATLKHRNYRVSMQEAQKHSGLQEKLCNIININLNMYYVSLLSKHRSWHFMKKKLYFRNTITIEQNYKMHRAVQKLNNKKKAFSGVLYWTVTFCWLEFPSPPPFDPMRPRRAVVSASIFLSLLCCKNLSSDTPTRPDCSLLRFPVYKNNNNWHSSSLCSDAHSSGYFPDFNTYRTNDISRILSCKIWIAWLSYVDLLTLSRAWWQF